MKAYLLGLVFFLLISTCTGEQANPPAPVLEEKQEAINNSSERLSEESYPENLEEQGEESLPQQGDVPLEDLGNSNIYVNTVIDGDTIKISTGERVRLICIDTPERGEYYYSEATNYLKSLVLNKEITLIKDVSETDRYGRLLRYVYRGDTFINFELVEKGYAKVYRYAPDVNFCDELEEAEARARDDHLGIWRVSESAPSSPSSEYVCTSNYYNCGDFSTHTQAQAAYGACGGISNDVHGLDRDKDGVACES